MAEIQAVRQTLASVGQEHLLAFLDELDQAGREELIGQIKRVNWSHLAELIQSHVLREPLAEIPANLAPPEILPTEAPDDATKHSYAKARAAGEELLAAGKVAAFVVAGGQGTRLGYDGPKGCYPVTPITNKSLFATFAEQILATGRRYGKAAPWYVMTSVTNDEATRKFFADNDFFGLDRNNVKFFPQGMMPAVGLDGKVLLTDKAHMALSPNGHGGSLTALADSGSLAEMASRGVEHISYFQVDNPLVKVLDPLFLGLHALSGAEMSSKALPKRDPLEKVGNFCVADGKVAVIEYSDMPDDLACQTSSDGRLRFRAGSIAIHALTRAFVERITTGGTCLLPFHRALKKVPHLNAQGRYITPDEPNAVKLEMFVFDALTLVDETIILETSRVEEFSPLKNATGSDSLSTCLSDQVRRNAAWLETAGVDVPRDADGIVAAAIEISPLFALDETELTAKVDDLAIEPGQKLFLGE